ncbi:MAG: hypothetical protein HZA00_08590 [Nitrospinae bacterium]|nr:hypothetical protein [Nitrospinota bacterium]
MKRKSKKESIPEHFKTAEDAGELWDNHGLGDFWNQTKEADLRFHLKRRHCYVSLDSKIFHKLLLLSEKDGVSVETMTNLWIQEKLQETGKEGKNVVR